MTRRTGLTALLAILTSQFVSAQKRNPPTGNQGTGTALQFSPWTPPTEMTIHIGVPTFKYTITDGTNRVSFTVADLMMALKE